MSEIEEKRTALLLLEDGTCFEGKALGKVGTTTGEVCFNTSMTGYQEIFTDPSYFGQVLILTSSHIGNYGICEEDEESNSVKINGLICKNISVNHSRYQANENLDEYLVRNGVIAIYNIDTRMLVRKIRDKGAMNCIISSENLSKSELQALLAKAPSMVGRELASLVSTKEIYSVGDPKAEHRIAVLDLGIKKNILNCLAERGAYLKVFPARTKFETLMAFQPDGFFISNGPGDPASMDYGVETVKQMQSSGIPIFGICLGHQLLALANGAKTYKMHHGHRGANHPVYNRLTGLGEVTSQNHGFSIDYKSVEKCKNIEVTHVNLNDNSIEGIRIKEKNIFSVQYHPESSPGPHDSRYLFDDFIKLIKEYKKGR